MPPPLPNFVPVGQRPRGLDPTRHLKSRELWNRVRFHASATSYYRRVPANNGQAGGRDDGVDASWSSTPNNAKLAMALVHAMAYELQPFRIKPWYRRARTFVREGGIERFPSFLLERPASVLSLFRRILNSIPKHLRQIDIQSLSSFVLANKSPLAKFVALLVALRLYYHLLLYLHELLHAGPILIILTLLMLLYTVGLGDNTGAASGIPSAYSVFNRGMRRILGTVDGEQLARQYAGGAVMAAGRMNNFNVEVGNEFDDGGIGLNVEFPEGGGEEEQEQNLVNGRRRQRRLERLWQRMRAEGQGNDALEPVENNVENNDMARRNGNDEHYGNLLGVEVDHNNGPETPTSVNEAATEEAASINTARKSGKKARRRNLEMRREMQRQRQEAVAMGFVGVGIDDDVRELDARMALG